MALITVERSPTPSIEAGAGSSEDTEASISSDLDSTLHSYKRCESYFVIKGAALILHKSEYSSPLPQYAQKGGIQPHLQAMIKLLKPDDTIKLAVKIESERTQDRYLAVVEHDEAGEYAAMGFDCIDHMTIGLVLPIFADFSIKMDGDGGFSLTSNDRTHLMKPLSVQALWACLQSLHRAADLARLQNFYPNGLNHSKWIQYYLARIDSDQSCLNEWNLMDGLWSRRPESPVVFADLPQLSNAEAEVRTKLKQIMMTVDLDEITAKELRKLLEIEMGLSLEKHKSFLDNQMILVMGQMEAPSQILPFLYLGTEFNALNLEEMEENGIGYILNATKEIDNFYPGMFEYCNIRVFDNELEDLLKHFERAYQFIERACCAGSKCLVHCKMGISRSASTVIAFIMKHNNWSLQQSYDFVKSKRNCVCPNKGFLKQLQTYEGILGASNRRYLPVWHGKCGDIIQSSALEPAQEFTIDTHGNQDTSCDSGGSPLLKRLRELSGSASDVERPMSLSDSDEEVLLRDKLEGTVSNPKRPLTLTDLRHSTSDTGKEREGVYFNLLSENEDLARLNVPLVPPQKIRADSSWIKPGDFEVGLPNAASSPSFNPVRSELRRNRRSLPSLAHSFMESIQKVHEQKPKSKTVLSMQRSRSWELFTDRVIDDNATNDSDLEPSTLCRVGSVRQRKECYERLKAANSLPPKCSLNEETLEMIRAVGGRLARQRKLQDSQEDLNALSLVRKVIQFIEKGKYNEMKKFSSELDEAVVPDVVVSETPRNETVPGTVFHAIEIEITDSDIQRSASFGSNSPNTPNRERYVRRLVQSFEQPLRRHSFHSARRRKREKPSPLSKSAIPQ